MTDTYHVLLPIGSEGPFTCEELRDRLASGKVRSSDRIMHALTRKVCVLTEILPDAGDASKARAPVSERIRRSNSDRHVAVQQSSQRLQVAPLAPLASTAPSVVASTSLEVTTPEATLPESTPASIPTLASPELKKPRNPVVTIAVLIAVMLALVLIWRPSSGGGATIMQMSDISGMWKSLPNVKSTPLEITFQAEKGSLIITDSNGPRSAKATIEFAGPEALVLRLLPTDPQFGQILHFNRSAYGTTLSITSGPLGIGGGPLLMVKTAALKPAETPVDLSGGSK